MNQGAVVKPPVLFVSDVHLRQGDQAYLQQFLDFLNTDARHASRLFIHGDLFEFYVGPRQGKSDFYAPLRAAFLSLRGGGTQVTLLHGNRDYLIAHCFEDCGVTLVPDHALIELGGLKVRVSHGDELCIHDRSYQFWGRGVLRWRGLQCVFRALPLSVGTFMARRYRSISARKKRDAPGRGRLESILDGAKLVAGEFDVLVCGHIHELAETPVGTNEHPCRLFTTGAWEDGPNHIRWDARGFSLVQPR
ncbi:MAG: UDP-2,3-diacylglucosamine diphosphatase [Planctomycetes bacterium]|nr:UDP-2,3-diacylglucosamine diphosphatase [Planctomycetota bacterium]